MQPLSESEQAAVDAELQAGRKLNAIKIFKDATGAGLAESKSAVEARDVLLRGTRPEQFAPVESSGGASGVIAVLLILTALIVIGFLALIAFRP